MVHVVHDPLFIAWFCVCVPSQSAVQAFWDYYVRHTTCTATQLPGANAGKPDVGGAAKDAAKKTPFGFMNVGDLALDLPGSNVSKDDLPNNVKPGDAAGLPKGPTAKPPSGPSLPKVRLALLQEKVLPRCYLHY